MAGANGMSQKTGPKKAVAQATVPRATASPERFQRVGNGVVPTRAGTFDTPLSALSHVIAQDWNAGRSASVRKAYDAGIHAKLPPIRVMFFKDGSASLGDGNHRLTVARERGAKTVRVQWQRGHGKTAPHQFTIPRAEE